MAITFDNIGNGELAGMFQMALAQIGQSHHGSKHGPRGSQSIDSKC